MTVTVALCHSQHEPTASSMQATLSLFLGLCLQLHPSGASAPRAGARAYAVPVLVSNEAPPFFAVEGNNSAFAVTGYGLDTGVGVPRCRIRPAHAESGFRHVSGYPGDTRADIVFNASIRNASDGCEPPCFVAPATRPCCLATVVCDPPPAVIVPGAGLLSVENNVGWALNEAPVAYVP